MKLKLLAAAVATVACTQAIADTTVYGKMNVTMGAFDAADNFQMNSNSSRIGIKGETKLSDTLSAIYMAEYEAGIDDGVADDSSGDEFKARNIYVGLKGSFGTVMVGNHDTPLKMIQGKVDQFNDLPLGDMKNVFVGENRIGNVMAYVTPSVEGLTGMIALIPGEGSEDDSFADTISASVEYKGVKNLRLAVAFDSDAKGADTLRVVGEYKMGDLSLGALYQDADKAEDGDVIGKFGGVNVDEQEAFLLSGAYKIDKITLKAQYATSDSEAATGAGSFDTTQIAVGADYSLAKSTKVFAYYADFEWDLGSIGQADKDDNTIAIGMEHKF